MFSLACRTVKDAHSSLHFESSTGKLFIHWININIHSLTKKYCTAHRRFYTNGTGHFQFTIILYFVPPKFCISVVFNFTWDLKTMVTLKFGGTKRSIMVNLKMACGSLFSGKSTANTEVLLSLLFSPLSLL